MSSLQAGSSLQVGPHLCWRSAQPCMLATTAAAPPTQLQSGTVAWECLQGPELHYCCCCSGQMPPLLLLLPALGDCVPAAPQSSPTRWHWSLDLQAADTREGAQASGSALRAPARRSAPFASHHPTRLPQLSVRLSTWLHRCAHASAQVPCLLPPESAAGCPDNARWLPDDDDRHTRLDTGTALRALTCHQQRHEFIPQRSATHWPAVVIL
jgi:hypothetical protein